MAVKPLVKLTTDLDRPTRAMDACNVIVGLNAKRKDINADDAALFDDLRTPYLRPGRAGTCAAGVWPEQERLGFEWVKVVLVALVLVPSAASIPISKFL